MAFHHLDVTLTGNSQQLISVHTPVKQVLIHNTAGNATLSVGDKNLSASSFGFTVAGGATSPSLGPFSGETPFNLDEVRVIGTAPQVIHVTYIT